jgi:AraC-like DNA-binding protein/mannose-6-phosphate isomerase-like protein (cupin superfamily)
LRNSKKPVPDSVSLAPVKRMWDPRKSTVEAVPNNLVVSHEQPGIMHRPHWHAQVEVNFVFRGTMEYHMHGHAVALKAGDVCLFWGGLPHQVVDTSDDAFFIAIHLPLVHFFRLRLASELSHKLMHGATLLSDVADASDQASFRRWSDYIRSDHPGRREHAVDELLLRIERMQFESHQLIEPAGMIEGLAEPIDMQSFHNIGQICAFITENFREDIDSVDIASSADIHPKYAMSVFKKSTGMTLNEYVNLLRLSYAQALLMREDGNVLRVAMESGFGSLSAFNKSFRKIAGKSPSDFRRDSRLRTPLRREERPN